MSEKIKSLQELKEIVAGAKKAGRKVVFTNGCFDLLHRGHLHLLREAKKLGDLLVVAVNSDRSIKKIKGPRRPILPEEERTEILAALEVVDFIFTFDEENPGRAIAEIRPSILVKGGDWTEDKIVGKDTVEQDGGRVAVIPYLQGHSTTQIVERIQGK